MITRDDLALGADFCDRLELPGAFHHELISEIMRIEKLMSHKTPEEVEAWRRAQRSLLDAGEGTAISLAMRDRVAAVLDITVETSDLGRKLGRDHPFLASAGLTNWLVRYSRNPLILRGPR